MMSVFEGLEWHSNAELEALREEVDRLLAARDPSHPVLFLDPGLVAAHEAELEPGFDERLDQLVPADPADEEVLVS